jgi:hypothetical protein
MEVRSALADMGREPSRLPTEGLVMCLGVKPSCGVHSLLIHHDLIVMPPVVGLRTYAKGCHACDALVDEFGEVTQPKDGQS